MTPTPKRWPFLSGPDSSRQPLTMSCSRMRARPCACWSGSPPFASSEPHARVRSKMVKHSCVRNKIDMMLAPDTELISCESTDRIYRRDGFVKIGARLFRPSFAGLGIPNFSNSVLLRQVGGSFSLIGDQEFPVPLLRELGWKRLNSLAERRR